MAVSYGFLTIGNRLVRCHWKENERQSFPSGNWYCVDREEHLEEGNTFCDIGRLKG